MSLGAVSVGEIKNKKRVVAILIVLIIIISVLLFTCKRVGLYNIVPKSFYYRIERLLKTDTYQINNALVGMGSSGAFGHGLFAKKIYVPEMISDFAFALTIMNFGYTMGILVIILYAYILFVLYKCASCCKDLTNRRIIKGTFYMMLLQCGEHIFMNLGITPITGITLPFLSYGGSSMFSYTILFSLIIKITTSNSSYS